MAEVGHHGDDVVLDIAQVKTNVHAWRDLVVLVAALGESLEDIGFATNEAHESDDIPPGTAGSSQKVFGVILTDHKDRVLDRIYFSLDAMNDGEEAVYYVVTAANAVGVSGRGTIRHR